MLLRSIVLFVFITICQSSSAQSQWNDFPPYVEVVDSFFTNYSYEDYVEEYYLRFEKRPDGWHSVLYTRTGKDEKEPIDHHLWTYTSEEYLNIDLSRVTDGEFDEKYAEFKDDHKKYYFNICPFFGYDGWAYQVINTYGTSTNLPDSILYAIGRAYSTHATNLLNNNQGSSLDELRFDLKPGKNSLSKAQLETYLYHRRKAIDYYKLVSKRDPAFSTIIGNINTKYSNEYMTGFLDLRQYVNEEAAQRILKSKLYDEFILEFAKISLSSCDQNAILFTQGDNDTYAILYIQSKYGYRQDVCVINTSLIGANRYLDMLTDGQGESKPIKMTLKSDPHFVDISRNAIYINEEMENAIDAERFINFVSKDDNGFDYNGKKYFQIPSKHFSLEIDGTLLNWQIDKPYMIRNMLSVMDVIVNNHEDHSILFLNTTSPEYRIGLNDYLFPEGNHFKLLPTHKDSTVLSDHQKKIIDASIQRLKQSGKRMALDPTKKCHFTTGSGLRHQYFELAELLSKHQDERALEMMQLGLDLFSNEDLPLGSYSVDVLEFYLQQDDRSATLNLIRLWSAELDHGVTFLLRDKNVNIFANVDNFNRNTLIRLVSLSNEIDDAEIKEQLQRLIDKAKK